jgi:hypothetical protein
MKTLKERRRAHLRAEYKHIAKMCGAIVLMSVVAYTPFILFIMYP